VTPTTWSIADATETGSPRSLAIMQTWAPVDVPRLPGGGPPLRLHNTSTDTVEATAPGSAARMYVCGITPYDATHLGHAATYLAFDLVNRLWRDLGHDVDYVQNVTDIDDPLLERAARDQDDWVVLGMRETALFREDMAALRVIPPRHYIGAVEAMGEISELVGKLLAQGAAYRVDDPRHPDVYFDSAATGRFGYVSRYDEARMVELSRQRGGDPDRPGKRHPVDPLLWRMARAGEPSWESDLGAGRPGWHVECAAIALNRLGQQIDLNGGGSDLIFPHHECGAAHAEAFTGIAPFARHYTHTGMIGLDGEKMSKSRGNLVFVSKLRAEQVDPNAVRLALLAGHYRRDRPWTGELLAEAEGRLARWRDAVSRPTGPPAEDLLDRLRQHLADDLDTPSALAAVDSWAAAGRDGRGGATGPALARRSVDALLGVRL
jgi:L-cysteine:1D-myo-inositol 2-amino-2-deoxy-alpha-D-glucopyranoside ligase